jgi:hypothetical protein
VERSVMFKRKNAGICEKHFELSASLQALVEDWECSRACKM